MYGLPLIYSLPEEQRRALQAQIEACKAPSSLCTIDQSHLREMADLIKMLRDHPAQLSESVRQRCIKIVGEAP